MDETLLENLSLSEKEDFVKQKGQLIDAQDFYSFFILVYLLNQQHVKLFYDFNGILIDVEADKELNIENYLSDQLASALDGDT